VTTTRLLAETAARRAREALVAVAAPWLARLRDDPTLLVALVALPIALLFGLWPLVPSKVVPPVAVVPTPPLVVPTVPATPSPTPDPRATLVAATVAYAAPGGEVLGALEAGRAYQPLARWGVAYVLVDVAGSGPVWLPLEAVGLPAGVALADLAPPPAPLVVYVPQPVPVVDAVPAYAPRLVVDAVPVVDAVHLAPLAPAGTGDMPKADTRPTPVPAATGDMSKPSRRNIAEVTP
jgi:hypothetical protein